jgi:hypothetical protein
MKHITNAIFGFGHLLRQAKGLTPAVRILACAENGFCRLSK